MTTARVHQVIREEDMEDITQQLADVTQQVDMMDTEAGEFDLDNILSQYDDFAIELDSSTEQTETLVKDGTEAVDSDDIPLLRLQVSSPYGSTEWQGLLGLEGHLVLLDRQSLAFPEPLIRSEHYAESPTFKEQAQTNKVVLIHPSQVLFSRSLYAREETKRCRATARDEAKLAAADNGFMAGTACSSCPYNDESDKYDPDAGRTCSKFRVIRGTLPQHGSLEIEHRVRVNKNSYATNREFSEKLTDFREVNDRWPLISISTRRASVQDNRGRCIYYIHRTPAVESTESAVSKYVTDPNHPVRMLHSLLSNEIEKVIQQTASGDGEFKNEFYWSEFEDEVPPSKQKLYEVGLTLAERLDNWYYTIERDEVNNDWYITDRLA